MPRATLDPADEIETSAVVRETQTGPVLVPTPPAGDLRWWTEHNWTGGVELEQLSGLETFAIRTMNSTYVVTVLSPRSGEVIVRGGRFFPEPARAEIAGCSCGGSCLKVHAVYPGFCVEILREGERILTTPVQGVARIDRDHPAVL